MSEQVLGLLTGIVFGILLQQGRVLRFEKQVGAMRFTDMTIFKFMLSAIMVGMIGIQLLISMNLAQPSVKPTIPGALAVGGVLFGAGWAVTGYCPGTSVGAVAEGRFHAVFAILGMVAGAALFAEAYPVLEKTVITWGNLGKLTLPGVLGVSPWIVAAVLVVAYGSVLAVFEKMGI